MGIKGAPLDHSKHLLRSTYWDAKARMSLSRLGFRVAESVGGQSEVGIGRIRRGGGG
jgi:hypothetical protein